MRHHYQRTPEDYGDGIFGDMARELVCVRRWRVCVNFGTAAVCVRTHEFSVGWAHVWRARLCVSQNPENSVVDDDLPSVKTRC